MSFRPPASDSLVAAAIIALALALAPGAARSAAPFVTDDARVFDARACQVESYVRRNDDSTEYWLLPACNFTGNVELSFGGARTSDAGGTRTTDLVLQAKTAFWALQANGWSLGLVAGNVRHPGAHSGAIGDLYAYVPASFSFRDDAMLLHANLGWLHEKETGKHRMTWALASENQLGRAAWLIAEVFGQNQGRPFYQGGVRFSIVPNHLQLDSTFGNRFGSGRGERWFAIGLRFLSVPFLP
jgi:hypothetical protein